MIAKKDQTVENVRAALNAPEHQDIRLEDISLRVLRKDPSIAEAYIAAGKANPYPIYFLLENDIPVNRELCLNACVICGEDITHTPEELIDHAFLMEVVKARPQEFFLLLGMGWHTGIYPQTGISPELLELIQEAALPRAYLKKYHNVVISEHLDEEEPFAIREDHLSRTMDAIPTDFVIAAAKALSEKRSAQKNGRPATSSKETMKAFRADVDKLLIENGIDDDKAFAISDAIYDCAERHFGFGSKPAPAPEVCVSVSLVRERACENELWADNLKVLFDAEELKKLSAEIGMDKAVHTLMKRQIQKGLASAKGWKQICFASRDYNWGDCANDDFEQLMDGDGYDSTEAVTIKVNQDEHLTPEAVPVKVCIRFKWDEERMVDGVLDMRDGTLECETIQATEHEIRDIESAKVLFEDGAVPLDPEEEFLRLAIN